MNPASILTNTDRILTLLTTFLHFCKARTNKAVVALNEAAIVAVVGFEAPRCPSRRTASLLLTDRESDPYRLKAGISQIECALFLAARPRNNRTFLKLTAKYGPSLP